MKGILAIVLIAAFAAVCESYTNAQLNQLCIFPLDYSASTRYDWELVEQCFSRWPLTAAKKAYYKEIAQKGIQSYVFQEWLAGPLSEGGLDDTDVNATQVIDAVFARNYASEWEFHNYFDREIRKFNDFHTQWFKPCWGTLEATQPFLVGSRMVSGQQEVYITGVDWETSSSNFAQYINKKVIAIDGKNPISYLIGRGKLGYKSRDPHSQFNRGLWINNRWYSPDVNPPKTVTYTFKNNNGANFNVTTPVMYVNSGSIEVVSWNIDVRSGISNLEDACWWEKKRSTDETETATKVRDSRVGSRNEFREEIRRPAVVDETPKEENANANENQERLAIPVSSFPNVLEFGSFGTDTAVLRVYSFTIFEGDIPDCILEVDQFIAWAAAVGRIKLIVDVVNNMGGSGMLALALRDRLIHPVIPKNWVGSYIASPYITEAAKTDVEIWASLFAKEVPFAKIPYTDESWIVPGRYIPFGFGGSLTVPITKKYSQRVYFNQDYVNVPPITNNYPFSKIMLFGNGICVSACHTFTWTMSWQVGLVTRVVYGGVPSSSVTPNFASGPVAESANNAWDLIENCNTPKCNNLRIPRAATQDLRDREPLFQYVMGATFPEYSLFGRDLPLEFRTYPTYGVVRLNNWSNMYDGTGLYQQAVNSVLGW